MNDFTKGYMRGYKDAQKEALSAQPEQEPVAWWIPKAEQFCLPSSDGTRPFAKAWEPLYTTPPQRKEPEQRIVSEHLDPVAIVDSTIPGHIEFFPKQGTKLYTTPPQRTWVGLTEKEILECRSANHLYFYKAIEAELKAKNERLEKNT